MTGTARRLQRTAVVELRARPPRLQAGKPAWPVHLPTEWLVRSATFKPRGGVDRLDDGEMVRFVRSGWMVRTRLLNDARRQLIELLLPGDHLPVSPAYRSDGLTALSPCEVVSVPRALVQAARERSPELDAALGAVEERRAAVLNERIVTMGRRTALERMAHLFCELLHRLADGEPADACELPMVQADLADLLGLSVVHTNRILQTLRRTAVVQVGGGRLRVLDVDALSKLADFSPDYLG